MSKKEQLLKELEELEKLAVINEKIQKGEDVGAQPLIVSGGIKEPEPDILDRHSKQISDLWGWQCEAKKKFKELDLYIRGVETTVKNLEAKCKKEVEGRDQLIEVINLAIEKLEEFLKKTENQ